jgi:competence protein ComEC
MRAGRLPWFLLFGIVAVVALALGHRDQIRARAEAALDKGMPTREAALARGFVLGEDERIDPATVEDFRRAGLSHLLAVSGQNIALLALLAMPLLAALGMPLPARLVWILAAIAIYVPLAGGGPSIVRAGVMGALSVLAMLAGRRTSRLYGLGVAAIVSLTIDPHIGADVGWQLSFAAVLGILWLAGPLREAIAARIGRRGWRGALAEGAAMTIAATLSTAPLIAFHFGGISTTTLLANLLALPAVAPAMWFGMFVSVGGQIPGFPAAALNTLAALLLAYIAQVAAWCGRPHWAYLEVQMGMTGLVVSYLGLVVAGVTIPALLRRRQLALLRQGRPRRPRRRPWAWVLRLATVALVASLWALRGVVDGRAAARPMGGLRVSVLDIGQGDAILLQPGAAPPVLVDGGPPGDNLLAKLRNAGVDSLGAVIVTHEQSDHAGGIEELLGGLPIEHLLYARLGRQLRQEVLAVHADPHRITAGDSFSSGRLRLEVLWPPAALLEDPLAGADPNAQALVLLARWNRFSMLLTADAEAAEVPIDPGPVDVLKVAHHGSEDVGLAALLDRTSPRLAVISVGEGNPYGHPAPSTMAQLAVNEVPTLRTDEAGTIVLDARKNSFVVAAGG